MMMIMMKKMNMMILMGMMKKILNMMIYEHGDENDEVVSIP